MKKALTLCAIAGICTGYIPGDANAISPRALEGKVCIVHAPAGSESKAFKMLLPKRAAAAHLRMHRGDRKLPPSACRLLKPGANK